jgi:uncharacterized protein
MSAPLPNRLDPWRAVHQGLAYAGEADLKDLPRLAEAVLGAAGPARYRLRFGRDVQGQTVAEGQAGMAVRLTCQRCLGEVVVTLEAPIALALVRADGAADALGLEPGPAVAGPLEALPLGEGSIHPLDLIEDELLLALPLVPLHAPGECQAVAAPDLPDLVAPQDQGGRPNPFAVLATLKDSGSQS